MKHDRLLPIAAAMFATMSAQAANVEMFGFFDQGLAYVHEELNAGMASPSGQLSANKVVNGKVADGVTRSNLAQGTGNVSTWGIKGSEKLTPDTKVIFHLESAFLADDGSIYGPKHNQLFERESSLGIESQTWGQLKFGRMPALTTGSGTTGIFNSKTNPFGAGWGNMTGGWKFVGTLAAARHDNMINYISPSWNGLKLHAQYSFKSNQSDYDEGTSQNDRWAALGATLTGEKFYLAAAVDWLDAASYGKGVKQSRDAYKALIGGHYNFDSFKLYGSAQYMKNIAYIGGYSTKEFAPLAATQAAADQKGFEAWAVATGIDFKAAGGTVKMSVGYGAAEDQNLSSDNKMQRVNVGLGYQNPLSKRTSIYGITGYFWQDADWQKDDITAHEVIIGLMHRW